MQDPLTITKPLALIGMMGSGKTHIGKRLAKALALDFYDSDALIEQKAGCTITEIFTRFGEHKFRESEKNTILDLLNKGPCIIATGGGSVTNTDTLAALKTNSVCIYLKADLETLWRRVKDNTARPLLQKDSPKQVLQNLLAARTKLYEHAHITIDIQRTASAKTVQSIIEALKNYPE